MQKEIRKGIKRRLKYFTKTAYLLTETGDTAPSEVLLDKDFDLFIDYLSGWIMNIIKEDKKNGKQ